MRLVVLTLLCVGAYLPASDLQAQALTGPDRGRDIGPPLHVRLTLKEFPRRTVSGAVLVADSGTVLLEDRRDTLYVALRTVRKVEMRGDQTGRGAGYGFLMGVAATVAMYGIAAMEDHANGPPCDYCIPTSIGALVLGVPFTALTTFIGASIKTYEWNEIDRAALRTPAQAP